MMLYLIIRFKRLDYVSFTRAVKTSPCLCRFSAKLLENLQTSIQIHEFLFLKKNLLAETFEHVGPG